MSTAEAIFRSLLVFGLFAACMWWLKRRASHSPGARRARRARIRILDSAAVTRQARVTVIAIDDKVLALGVGQQVTVLAELDPALAAEDAPAQSQPVAPTVAAWLARLRGKPAAARLLEKGPFAKILADHTTQSTEPEA